MIFSTLLFLSNSFFINKDTSFKDNWDTLRLGRWTIQVPQNFIDSSLKPYDTYVGIIYSKTDSFHFGYEYSISPDIMFLEDSLVELGEENCELSEQIKSVKEQISSPLNGWQKSYGDTSLYKIYCDTIDSKAALIVYPVKDKTGNFIIQISNCRPRAFIEIWGKNLTVEEKELFFRIALSIKFLNE